MDGAAPGWFSKSVFPRLFLASHPLRPVLFDRVVPQGPRINYACMSLRLRKRLAALLDVLAKLVSTRRGLGTHQSAFLVPADGTSMSHRQALKERGTMHYEVRNL